VPNDTQRHNIQVSPSFSDAGLISVKGVGISTRNGRIKFLQLAAFFIDSARSSRISGFANI
jgi:hypothetical protein